MEKSFIKVMLSFLKIGAIGFGGGAALLPIFERELVENRQWMDKRQFDMTAAVASITPASLPVALCAIWDARYSIISAFAYAIPGPLIYLVLLTGFSYIGEAGTKYLQFTSVGLIAFVLFLICRFIKKNFLFSVKSGIKTQYIFIMAAAFLLTGGTVLRRIALMLFEIDLSVPLFSVNMLTLMIMTFFIIIFIGGSKSKIKLCIAFIPAGLYALSNGKAGVLQQWSFPILISMIVLASSSVVYDVIQSKEGKTEKKQFKFDYKPFRNLLLFVLIAAAFLAASHVVSREADVWDYSNKVVSSSLTSFGGGEVYIGISEATFVQTGFISEQIFNTQIIGVANILPGPILVNIITGVGYTYGNATNGVGCGWLIGILGLVLAVMITAVGALPLSVFFEALKDSSRLLMIIKYIMSAVCGMLVSTALSLLLQSSSVLTGIGANVFLSIGIVFAILFVMMFLHLKFRLNDLLLLLISGGGTLAVLGIIDSLY